MDTRSVISLTTGLEDAEKVTVAFLVAVGSAESKRPTLMFLTKEAVRLVVGDVGRGTACQGCPPLEDLMRGAGGGGVRYLVCPFWLAAPSLAWGHLVAHAELGGTVPMWEWIGDAAANTFSY